MRWLRVLPDSWTGSALRGAWPVAGRSISSSVERPETIPMLSLQCFVEIRSAFIRTSEAGPST